MKALYWQGRGLAISGPLLGSPPPPPAAGGLLSKDVPTSRLVKLQGDMGIKAQAEVVVEDIQRQLEEGQGTGMRGSHLYPTPPHSHLCRNGASDRPSQLLGSPAQRLHTKAACAWLAFLPRPHPADDPPP